jgi:hypothetical protein
MSRLAAPHAAYGAASVEESRQVSSHVHFYVRARYQLNRQSARAVRVCVVSPRGARSPCWRRLRGQ